MRILYGALKPTAGTIQTEGQTRHFRSAKEAIAAGIGMVSQHYSVIPELTCLQNLVLGAEPALALDRKSLRATAQELATSMGFNFDWDAPAEGIGPAQAQKLEILKLLWRKARILILDEPTAMLSPEDSDLLYAKLKDLAQAGNTVLVVTHRIPEVMEHCHEVTVLRAGKLVASKTIAQTDPEELTTLVVGHPVESIPPEPPTRGHPVLQVQNLTVPGHRGESALKSATFTLFQGELVGIAGVDGNGQRELFQALLGVTRPTSGKITLEGQDITQSPTAKRIAAGLRYIAEDRHEEAVVDDWPILENAILGLQRHPQVQKALGIDPAAKKDLAEAATTRFPTRFDSIHQRFGALSGGNQQKVVTARALQLAPRLLLAFQPTRGIDINVSAQVFQALQQETRKGAAVLLVSFDIDEILAHCDRVLVLNHGHLAEPPAPLSRDRQAIGRLMVGATGTDRHTPEGDAP